MSGQVTHSGAETAEKLALTLAASLILHFALIFGLQIRSAPSSSHVSRVIQARLVEAPDIAPAVVTAQPPEPESLVVEAQEAPLPPPDPPVFETAAAVTPLASAAVPEMNTSLPSIEVPLIEDPTYYPALEVDVHPTALQIIRPTYPDEAASSNVTGSVVLVLLLDESGKVQELSVEDANPSGMFEQSALDAFRNARFSPAQRNGRVVKSRMRIKVTYELPSVDKTKQK
ncbi:MAG: TonB family protein [Gammaproteobacteria bacterium]|nr:TonB family protein [Gammaproteobacteria bacterium]MBU1733194.1 TonB family protein [Gammaproteobacteria bacterium]MBU1892242.1 TonB family protein [Gammaproteobacteria bacterium]